jgi:hypothetical protein
MSCRVKWNRDFVFQHFEKNYVATDYRIYRENILFEKEMGLLPMTQPYVEKAMAVEKIQEEIEEINKEQIKLSQQIKNKYDEIRRLNSTNNVERRKYLRKCPQNECQGFLSQNLKCEICNSWVCSECREIKGDTRDAEHTCNPEILESVKLLEADTKPCPKCSSMIYKIEGCAQMFCTECHTAFNWNTLRIENGVIHNPHYFEWMRRQNENGGQMERNPNEIVCGRELDHHFAQAIQKAFVKIYNNTAPYSNVEFKQKIMALLLTTFKSTYPEYYKKIVNHIETSAELKKDKYKLKSSRYEYASLLIQMVNQYIMSHRHSLNINEGNIQECIEQLKQMEIRKFDEKPILIQNIIRNIIHIRQIEMGRWNVPDTINNNLNLRIQYMRNRMTSDKFKIQIQKRDKETQRNVEMANILRMFVSCMTDLLYRVLEKITTCCNQTETNSKDEINKALLEIFGDEQNEECILKECHELRNYTNTCMETTLRVYGSTMRHCINKNFEYSIK